MIMGPNRFPGSTILRLPDIPRCAITEPMPTSITKYLPRRQTSKTLLPTRKSGSATGHRKLGFRTTIDWILRFFIQGLTPCRVVSTSGSSGKHSPANINKVLAYFIFPSVYSTCLRMTGSNFFISSLSGLFRLFLVVV